LSFLLYDSDDEFCMCEKICVFILKLNPDVYKLNIIFCVFFGGQECVGHSFSYVAHFVLLVLMGEGKEGAEPILTTAKNIISIFPVPCVSLHTRTYI
jgi:hypothetical protein